MSNPSTLKTVLTTGCLLVGAYAATAATPTPPATRPADTSPAAAPSGEGEREGRPAANAPARGGRGAAAAPANLESAMSDMNRMLTAIKHEAADPAQAEQAL